MITTGGLGSGNYGPMMNSLAMLGGGYGRKKRSSQRETELEDSLVVNSVEKNMKDGDGAT